MIQRPNEIWFFFAFFFQLSAPTSDSVLDLVSYLRSADYANALAYYTSMVSGPSFAEIAAFMPAIKVLIQHCIQLQVAIQKKKKKKKPDRFPHVVLPSLFLYNCFCTHVIQDFMKNLLLLLLFDIKIIAIIFITFSYFLNGRACKRRKSNYRFNKGRVFITFLKEKKAKYIACFIIINSSHKNVTNVVNVYFDSSRNSW